VKKVIAIDGPSGAGKSTLAKLLAKELGYAYLDTGALYRAVALNLMRLGINESSSDEELLPALEKTDVEFRKGRVLLNGEDVSRDIRSPEAGHYASVFSAKKAVREHLLQIQRDAALHTDLVAEGRDMTTVVFPDADKKFYLDASVEERAGRRALELLSRGFDINSERIRLDIVERDARDSGRDIAPLKKADDAYLIDSSGLAVDAVFRKILDIINKERNEG
jgi:cytidylate kinase